MKNEKIWRFFKPTAWKIILTIIIFYSSIVFVSAYIEIRPIFFIKMNNLSNCYFVSFNDNLSSDANITNFIKNKNSRCENLTLNKDDEDIFRNIINQYNKDYHPYKFINIEEQSNENYFIFMREIEKTNLNECDCKSVYNITRLNNWTVYIESRDCGENAIPPKGCPGRLSKLFWKSSIVLLVLIFVVPIIIIIGLMSLTMFIFKKIEKKKKKSGLKMFFKPSWSKAILIEVFLFIVLGCLFSDSFSFILQFLALPVLMSSAFLSEIERSSFWFIIVVQMIYWYLLSCVILYLISKIRKNVKRK